jgi:hypothetical protein
VKVSVLFSVVFTGSQTHDPTAKVSVTTNTGPMFFVFCRLYPEPNQGPNCESKCYNPYGTNVFCFLSSLPRSQTRDPTAKVSVTTNTGSMYFVFCRLYPEQNQDPTAKVSVTTNTGPMYFVVCCLYPEPNQGPNCESRCCNQYGTNIFCCLSSLPGAKPGTQLRK